MKRTLLLAITCATIVISSCSKNDLDYRKVDCEEEQLIKQSRQEFISQDELVTKYLPVWKKMLMEYSNLSEDFFNKHIKVFYADTSIYDNTIYLAVGLEYQVEWATANVYNEIAIRVTNVSSPFYKEGIVPLNTDLTEAQSKNLRHKEDDYFANRLYKLSGDTALILNFAAAKEMLRRKLQVSKICESWCTVNNEGHLSLQYNDHYFDEKQYCSYAEIDLINGNTEATVGECVID